MTRLLTPETRSLPLRRLTLLFLPQIKNRMFANGRAFGGDLIATDIMRGREHGLPSYNDYRQTCGLRRAGNWQGFSDLISQRVRK